MDKQNVLRFCTSVRETFWMLIVLPGINKYGKSGAVQISTVFEPVYNVTSWRVFWNQTF